MTQNHLYRVAGHSGCADGTSGNGVVASQAYLWYPLGIKINNGDLYIADAGNNRVVEDYGGGNQWNQSMTKYDIYTVAGSSSGTLGNNGAGGAGQQRPAELS